MKDRILLGEYVLSSEPTKDELRQYAGWLKETKPDVVVAELSASLLEPHDLDGRVNIYITAYGKTFKGALEAIRKTTESACDATFTMNGDDQAGMPTPRD